MWLLCSIRFRHSYLELRAHLPLLAERGQLLQALEARERVRRLGVAARRRRAVPARGGRSVAWCACGCENDLSLDRNASGIGR